uniref:Small ribosomal subunit protein uS3c n=1 Tax=Monomastix sp. (strain OKE-1) TaxID=141716 RepID=U5YDZ8_MONSK|nr:ribosomal protein S3 [Monomastix sp. OKE-1]AGZ90203.1 ribosomal protein S3 [Monomastix sp. OKE-1]
MGQKANPISLRLSFNRDFESCWYQDLNYSKILLEELTLRKYILSLFSSMNVYQGRVLFQIFPKKCVIYSFITNKKTQLNSPLKLKAGGGTRFKTSLNSSAPRGTLRILPKNATKQDGILHFMEYALQRFDSVNHLAPSASIAGFLYLISKSMQTSEKRMVALYGSGDKQKGKHAKSVPKLPLSLSSFPHVVASPLEAFTGSKVDFVPVKLHSRYQSASFLSQYIAQSIEKSMSFRQIFRIIQKDILRDSKILGMKIQCSGRINGAEIAKVESKKMGQTSLHTFSARVDFGTAEAYTMYGIIGIKVWLSSISEENL